MQKINQKYIRSVIQQALREDLSPSGDITTRNIKNRKVTAKIIAGQNCLVGGLNFAKEAFKISNKKITFKAKTKDGRKIKRGKIVAVIKGKASNIIKSERVALNFLGLISGVATITNKFVKKVKGKSCKICCTRKTLPNLRLIQKYGVRLGGGTNHRFNLSSEILIKDNHIAAHKNIRELVKKAIKNKDGKKITRGKVIAVIKGKASKILKSERVALNFLGLVSGVATITNKFVKKVKSKSCKICCTRKTLPNLRLLQKYGVSLGGGTNHRFNLSDEILIKDNHIAINNDIHSLVKRAIKNKKGKKITVEVESLIQLKKIIGLKFDRVLFDNMDIKSLREGVKIAKKYYETEASGNISLNTVKNVSKTGVDRISVGSITHSAPALDLKLEI